MEEQKAKEPSKIELQNEFESLKSQVGHLKFSVEVFNAQMLQICQRMLQINEALNKPEPTPQDIKVVTPEVV